MNMTRRVLLFLFLLLLPWQTRWIFGETLVLGDVSEYGRLSIYLFDVVLVAFLAASAEWFTWSRIKERFSSPAWKYAGIASFALVVWSLLSVLWSPEPLVTVLFSVHLLLALGLMILLVIDQSIHPVMLLGGLAIGMLVPALAGWLQSSAQEVVASTLLGLAAQDPAVLGTAVIEHSDGRWLRAYGSFPHPNIFGGFLVVGLLSAIVSSTLMSDHRWEYFYLGIIAILSGALVLSASRAAWVAYVLGLLVLFGGYVWIGARGLRKRLQFPVGISLLIILIIGISLHPILGTRFDPGNRLEEISSTQRSAQWQEAGELLTRSPGTFLFGGGAAAYTFSLEQAHPLRSVWAYQPVHNVPALVFVELGLVGLGLLLVFVVAADVGTHARWKRPAAVVVMALGTSILVLALFDHYLWTSVSGLYLLAVFFAINMRLGERRLGVRDASTKPHR